MPSQEYHDPILQLEGKLQRITTFGDLSPINDDHGDLDTMVRTKDFKNLRALLKSQKIDHVDGGDRHFWTDQLLGKIMTRPRVMEELERMRERERKGQLFRVLNKKVKETKLFIKHNVDWYTSKICSMGAIAQGIAYGANNCLKDDVSKVPGPKSYLKIFTILLMCQRKTDIWRFIKYEIGDSDLPLAGFETLNQENELVHTRLGTPVRKNTCFKGWKTSETELFQIYQFRVLVPFLGPSSDQKAGIRHVEYHPSTILPWVQEDPKRTEGGYGVVSCIRPHPTAHGFHNLKQVKSGNGVFALKVITTKKPGDFDQEAKMLRLFSGRHDHLITLLMTYSLNNQNSLLFPWAECDLETFWKITRSPFDKHNKVMNFGWMKWISTQILGIVSALDNIHNPPHLASEDKKYAKHGDIKPENILWFPPNGRTEGILVIGDLGISSIHGEKSKSNVPNESLPRSPDYRPPECDQRGGAISRAFDVWTLGCLLMEMICWALGGSDMLQEFDHDRSRVPYMGIRSNIWFDVKNLEDGDTVIMVKEIVVEWMRKLDEHEGCTEYFHDLIDIIYDRMIIVLSKGVDRIRSGPLLEEIEAKHARIEDPSYSQVKGLPRKRYNDPVAVRTEMNSEAKKRIKKHADLLQRYEGAAPQKAKTELEMQNVD